MRKRKFEITVHRDGPTAGVFVEGSGSGEDFETAAAAIVLSLIKMLKADGSGYEAADILETVCEFIIEYVADNMDATFVGDMSAADEKLVKELDRYAMHMDDEEEAAAGGAPGQENCETEGA